MYKTLHIFTNSGRENFRRVIHAIPRHGFEFARSTSIESKSGLQVSAIVKYCGGDETDALSKLVATLPQGSRIIVDEKHPFH